MGWSYEFITLTDEEKHARRESLDFHAAVAHYSFIAPVIVLVLIRLARLSISRLSSTRDRDGAGAYQRVPGSPIVKARNGELSGGLAVTWRKFKWWTQDDIRFFGQVWGQRDEWILGSVWMLWLLTLCVAGTGKDFLHLTKRFGIIAMSQLAPLYMLILKSVNPICFALGTSHERLNRYHRVLGRLVYVLTLLHVVFYNVFFLASGLWVRRFFAPIVFAGVVASVAMHALAATAAVRAVRQWSYRVFFITHLFTAMLVPPLIFFHAPSARLYVVEAAALFAVDLAVRKTTAVTVTATLEAIPGTDLVRVSAPLPSASASKLASEYRARPASHVYVSVPPEGRPTANPASPSHFIFDFLYNPFTVAAVSPPTPSSTDTVLSLVFRRHAGPMTSHLHSSSSSATAKASLVIDGPYGEASLSFPSFLSQKGGVHRILLFAGGVGATFILPIYNTLVADYPAARVRLVWSIRTPADAAWATASQVGAAKPSLHEDENVQLFITGDVGSATGSSRGGGNSSRGLELTNLQREQARRPDIRKIVDETFRLGQAETVAVLVCGPVGMAQDVRNAVRPWVMRGRKVWWHDETFGW